MFPYLGVIVDVDIWRNPPEIVAQFWLAIGNNLRERNDDKKDGREGKRKKEKLTEPYKYSVLFPFPFVEKFYVLNM